MRMPLLQGGGDFMYGILLLSLVFHSNSLSESTSSASSSGRSRWLPLPHHHDRRKILLSGAGVASTLTTTTTAGNVHAETPENEATFRSVATVNSHPIIPVWPSWAGGRVVPVSLGNEGEDPFLLLAHHKHWFDPRDPFREPFKAFGKRLGLPYVDVEGFAMHPHRGFDILTYVCDGSDGFCHKDSLGGKRIYRGGCAQWMRTGSGVLHEEFWETRDDRRTNIELFQIWVNLPSYQKFDKPAVQYVGMSTDCPWSEEQLTSGVNVRDVTGTLKASFDSNPSDGENNSNGIQVRDRPPVQIQHILIPPGATYFGGIPQTHSSVLYVREGSATIFADNMQESVVKALQSATFHPDVETVQISNTQKRPLDLLFLSGEPLREPVAMGGPIVMNAEQEIYDAYQQLKVGTFLDRDVAIRQQEVTKGRRPGQTM